MVSPPFLPHLSPCPGPCSLENCNLIFEFCKKKNLQLTNIGSIIVSTQQADWTIIACGVPSYALELYPNFSFTHTPFVNNSSAAANSSAAGGNGSSTTADSPFGDAYVISLGYLIVLAAAVPLGYMNLDDNIWVQIICAGILILVVFTAW